MSFKANVTAKCAGCGKDGMETKVLIEGEKTVEVIPTSDGYFSVGCFKDNGFYLVSETLHTTLESAEQKALNFLYK